MKYDFDPIAWFLERVFRYRNKCNILLWKYPIRLMCFIKGVRIGRNVDFNGFPVIRRYENSKIIIGDKCTFNSARFSVRVGLRERCTLVTLLKKSEIVFGNNSGGSGIMVLAAKKIIVGNNVLIGSHTMIIDTDFHHADPGKRYENENIPARPIIIEDNVFIGTNCMILKGVTIGKNSVIGANSVVITSIPENSIAIGNPCKIIIKKSWGAPKVKN
jgi:UDP-3-O-[3-hydroxymyristoyl] glucosamine N-acyltransferase